MFKRRNPLTWLQTIGRFFWPKGGWRRAASYIAHRLHRLPDNPKKIARGVAVGVAVCFTPLFGLHFFTAIFISILIRGNIVASLLATFFGNPITFPFIAATCLYVGNVILGTPHDIPISEIFSALGAATAEIPRNIMAMFTDDVARWGKVWRFYDRVFWPYLIGGILPGIFAGFCAYFVSYPIISAYQKRRRKKTQKRFEAMHIQAENMADDDNNKL